MNDITLTEVVKFFERLNLAKKVEMLSELTDILNKGIKEEEAAAEKDSAEEDAVIDALFGAWAEEEGLNEDTIIDRTVSEREINLN